MVTKIWVMMKNHLGIRLWILIDCQIIIQFFAVIFPN